MTAEALSSTGAKANTAPVTERTIRSKPASRPGKLWNLRNIADAPGGLLKLVGKSAHVTAPGNRLPGTFSGQGGYDISSNIAHILNGRVDPNLITVVDQRI